LVLEELWAELQYWEQAQQVFCYFLQVAEAEAMVAHQLILMRRLNIKRA
jgi:hypothetical protein